MKLLFTFLVASQFLSAQVWVQLPDFPAQKRDDGVAVVVNNKAYFGTGLIEWASTIDFHVLDLTNYSWSSMPNMPNTTERQYGCAFAGTNCFYVFGGDGVGGALNNMYKYDISTSTWTIAASKPGNGLVGAACMNFGDKVIISGGKFQSGKASAEVWEYTISTDSWLQKNNYPFAGRWRASATVHNNAGYLIFGRDTGGAYRKEFYKYTPATDSWTKIMDFPTTKGRAYSSLNVANTKLCVFGGIDSLNQCYKDIWYFNESNSSWLQGPDIPAIARKGGMSCSLGANLYYTCGIADGDMRLTETWMTDIPVGITKNSAATAFSLYPNPTTGWVRIIGTDKFAGRLSCRCEDACGRIFGVLEIGSNSEIDLSHLETGIYFLKFYSENKLADVKRILKN